MIDDKNSSAIDAIRTSYDRVAGAYTEAIFHELENKPFDREILTRFAGSAGGGRLIEIGCGPGQVSRFLRDQGATISGVDLSPAMVEQARRFNPDIPFAIGDMTALALENGSIGAIVAFYAIVNLAAEMRQTAFREMARVLTPGGHLLLSFHIGDEVINPKEMWGKPVKMSFYMLDPEMIRAELEREGFAIEELTIREPYAPKVEHQTRRAYVWARKNGPL